MKMKKFINDPENLTPELLEGFAEAHKDLVVLGDERMVINKKLDSADRVTIVTQGGSGHEPAISGFVGEGMVDISVVGDVFAAPGPQACVDAIKLADKGKYPGVPRRRGSPHLYRNLSDLGIDVIKEPLQVPHDPANQQLFEPVREPVGEKIHKPLP